MTVQPPDHSPCIEAPVSPIDRLLLLYTDDGSDSGVDLDCDRVLHLVLRLRIVARLHTIAEIKIITDL
jgi:hypothetical protein